jgi:Uma2 family endonuclease
MTPNDQLLFEADKVGIRLEIQNGLPLWEASPLWEHQEQIDRIRTSIVRTGEECACVHISDVYIAFPNSRKRPDIAIFCQEPTPEQKHTLLTLIPCAVIEVVSRGYELKDIELGPPFYLANGVQHVIVFDPATQYVLHFQPMEVKRFLSPIEIALRCGCKVTV